jgi:alkanesulfonate monooxygenase SsuD/methylene tetrahydromethanopterin reductase-like flavin-dependent oxidoreductase (luciferase family)
MLRLIAKHADAWNSGFVAPTGFREEKARLEKACKEVGRDRGLIENTFQSRVIIADDDETACRRAEEWREERGGKPEDGDWRFAIKGSPEKCEQIIRAYVAAGVTHFTLLLADVAELEPLRLFSKKVVPRFR